MVQIRTQTVHMLQVLKDGQLLDVHTVGPTCHADDKLTIQLAQQSEQRWQQQLLLARQQSHAAAGPSGGSTYKHRSEQAPTQHLHMQQVHQAHQFSTVQLHCTVVLVVSVQVAAVSPTLW